MISALSSGATFALEFDDAASAINYRQETFGHIESQLKLLKRSIKKSDNLTSGDALAIVRNISNESQHLIAAFTPVSYQGKTKADADIWDEWPRFEQLMSDYLGNLRDLESAIQSNHKKQAMNALRSAARSCKSCHISYRDFW
nr:cytochrome c [Pseudomaricurvus alkylphenolicus]